MNLATKVSVALVSLVLVAAVVFQVALRPRIDLVLVNPGAQALTVRVFGDAVDVPAGGTLRLDRLPAAGLRVEAPGAAAITTDCPAEALGPRPTWVWSVAPVTTWWEVSMGYGDLAHVGSTVRPFAAPGPLFPLPSEGFLPIVDGLLPTQAKVKKGTTGTVLSALWSDGFADRFREQRARIIVHNGTPFTLSVDTGAAEPTLLAGDGAMLELSDVAPGPVSLRATTVRGEEKLEFTVTGEVAAGAPLGGAGLYVWNVGEFAKYWVVSRRYGPDPEAGDPAPRPARFETSGPLFRVPDGFYPALDVPFPERWHTAEVLRFLWSETHFGRSAPPELPPDLLKRGPDGGPPAPEPTSPPEPLPFPGPPPARDDGPAPDSPFPPVRDEDGR